MCCCIDSCGNGNQIAGQSANHDALVEIVLGTFDEFCSWNWDWNAVHVEFCIVLQNAFLEPSRRYL